MDEVKCSGTENNLWDCKVPRDTHCEADNYVTVKCSGSIELSLKRKGKTDDCAGVVQFNTTNGYVSVCNNKWDEGKADMVCKELKCGKHYKIPQSGTFQGEQMSYSIPLRCTGNEKFSWQCVNWVEAKSSTCRQEASVICSNRVKVELEFSCYGNIYVRLNDTVHTVCSDGMTEEAQERMGELVCQQLNCGKILNVSRGSEVQNVLLKQVDCSGQEDSLWECLARYWPGQPCQSTARVSCAGWRRLLLTDPDNACAGKVYARDQSGLMAVSRDGWGTDKGEEL
ncbi:hypothetical protein MHYP_G00326750 [Metynnis hypsauchen]